MPKGLTPRLQAIKDEVEGYAREFGLDCFETIFEVLTFDELNMVAAYGGFPTRYPHWRWGMEYEQLSKGYEYGLSKIYELVINNEPCYAYLQESNSDVDQKLVMAHVYGHCDFFKNNFSFRHTNRRMVDEMANHATRVRRWIDKIGVEKVEDFIDRALSLENLIDQHAPHIKRNPDPKTQEAQLKQNERVEGFKVNREYMRGYVNPPEFLDAQRQKVEREKEARKHFPERPQRDVLLFLLENAPLEQWEFDILAILREEAYYFAPQGQTKIMNEGWASYWHSTIMTTRALKDDEVIDYADRHAGTMATKPGQLNPYKLGIELWRDIEDRWNKGRFGKEYDEAGRLGERDGWDRGLGQGREKIFEVRRIYNDATFIDEFMTPEFIEKHKFYQYGRDPHTGQLRILSRDPQRIKQTMLYRLTNMGRPFIYVVDGNYANRGELFLAHRHNGLDIEIKYAVETLKNLVRIWGRPCHLQARIDDEMILFTHDGEAAKHQIIKDDLPKPVHEIA